MTERLRVVPADQPTREDLRAALGGRGSGRSRQCRRCRLARQSPGRASAGAVRAGALDAGPLWHPRAMTSARRAVTPDRLGAWLLKVSPDVSAVHELLESGFTSVTHRCVRPSYRTDLVRAGQPVLCWVSGGDRAVPAGIYGQGRTTGVPEPAPGSRLDVPVELRPLEPPVLRGELLAHPTLGRIEVLRIAAGSNPSFLTRDEVEDLCAQWPQVTVG